MRAILSGMIVTLLLTSCVPMLTPEERAHFFGKEPSLSEIAALLEDYATRNNLVVAAPQDSIKRQPGVGTIIPAYMRPITIPVEQEEGTWPKEEPKSTGYVQLVETSGYPPANASETGYRATLRDTYESSTGKVVGEIEYRLFISKGVIKAFTYREKGDVHIVRKTK